WGPAGADGPLHWLALREGVGRNHGPNGRNPVLIDLRCQRVALVGKEDSGHGMDVVALDQFSQLRQGRCRIALGVLDDHFHLAPAHLLADLLEVHHEAARHILADCGAATRHLRQKSYLDRTLLAPSQTRSHHDHSYNYQERDDELFFHTILLL